jgi:hypothetical protein
MSDLDSKVVTLNGGEDVGAPRMVAGVEVPAPPPGAHLDHQRRRLFDWIYVQLIKDGRKVRASGIQIVMLVHTIDAWSKDMKICMSEVGRYGTSRDGNRYELPHSYNERKARDEIMRELPEACLTVMSSVEARLRESKMGETGQDDLFDELLEHGRARPTA